MNQSSQLCEAYFAERFGGESLSVPELPPDSLPQAVCALDFVQSEPVPWLAGSLLVAGEMGILVADGGVGKTTFALSLAAAIAGGYDVVGYHEFGTAQGPVLYVSEEDDAGVLRNRLDAIITGHGWERDRVLGNVHLLALSGVRLNNTEWQRHLTAEAERIRPRLVILDPLYELSEGNEDSNTDQRPVIQFLRGLMRRSGTAVLVVHHFGKSNQGKRKIDRPRGASAWFSAARVVIALEPHGTDLSIEVLKLSRARPPAPFVVQKQITVDPANPGIWQSAFLHYGASRTGSLDTAEQWVLDRLEDPATHFTTTDLRRLALGSGVSRAHLSRALRVLHSGHRIEFTPGRKGAKHWRVCPPGSLGNQGENRLPTLPDGCRASSDAQSAGCPPLKGVGNPGAGLCQGSTHWAGQGSSAAEHVEHR